MNTLTAEVLQDELAISLARALATANRKAHELGVDVFESLISITQHTLNGTTVWQINYGPKDYVKRRGGDVLIEVDVHDATIRKVLRGQ
jgi:hypothetical protein